MSCGARRAALGLTLVAAAGLLAACSTPPPPTQQQQQAKDAESAAPALRPLARQAAHPSGALPRSQVASVRYDLAVSGTDDLLPDDGMPGDGGPRDIYQHGGASWYGLEFHNRKTANGERFDMGAMTAAHRSLPFGTRVCVRSLVNGREVLVRINDRGPYAAGRIIDLSRAAASAIDMVGLGIKQVALSLIDPEGGRCAGALVADSVEPAPAPERRGPPPRKAVSQRR